MCRQVCMLTKTQMSVHMLHTTSIRFYVSPVPRPNQTYMPHTKSMLIFGIRDGGWTKFCQLKAIRGIVEITTAFARYATSAPPLPRRFNVDWQNIFHADPPPVCGYFNIEQWGRGGAEILVDVRIVHTRNFFYWQNFVHRRSRKGAVVHFPSFVTTPHKV